MLTIATMNVNGIRAAFRRGLGEWIAQREPDVLLLQEVRATTEMLVGLLGDGWHVAHEPGGVKGRAGVAVATRRPPTAVRAGLGSDAPTDTGRWIEVDVAAADGEALTVASVYVHSGTVDTPSMDEKFAFLDRMSARLTELADGAAIVGGDVNIAHREVDIKNWKGNLRSAGFLADERAYLDRWFDELGWVDLGRAHGGEGPGPYTWWSWRGKAFDNDAGWRIDYQLASPIVAPRAMKVEVDRGSSYDARMSDHAPLIATYDA